MASVAIFLDPEIRTLPLGQLLLSFQYHRCKSKIHHHLWWWKEVWIYCDTRMEIKAQAHNAMIGHQAITK